MLSLNIYEKHVKNDNNTSKSTIAESPTMSDRESILVKTKIYVDNLVKDILSTDSNDAAQYNDENNPGNMQQGLVPRQGGPGMGQNLGPQMHQEMGMGMGKTETGFKYKLKMFGWFMFHLSSLLLLRKLSYNFTR
jgi:hypothetical protein